MNQEIFNQVKELIIEHLGVDEESIVQKQR